MRGHSLRKRLAGGLLLLAVLAAAAGLHPHENLAGFSPAPGGEGASRVVSNHSPLSKASHWHSGKRVQDDPCLACHFQRFVALGGSAAHVEPAFSLVLSFAEQPGAASSALPFSESPRGPPSLS